MFANVNVFVFIANDVCSANRYVKLASLSVVISRHCCLNYDRTLNGNVTLEAFILTFIAALNI